MSSHTFDKYDVVYYIRCVCDFCGAVEEYESDEKDDVINQANRGGYHRIEPQGEMWCGVCDPSEDV